MFSPQRTCTCSKALRLQTFSFFLAQQCRGMTGEAGSAAAGLCPRCLEQDPPRRSTPPAAPQLHRRVQVGVQVGAMPRKWRSVCHVRDSRCLFSGEPVLFCSSDYIYSSGFKVALIEGSRAPRVDVPAASRGAGPPLLGRRSIPTPGTHCGGACSGSSAFSARTCPTQVQLPGPRAAVLPAHRKEGRPRDGRWGAALVLLHWEPGASPPR